MPSESEQPEYIETNHPKHLLVIRTGAMGDLLHVSGAVRQLHQAYPNVRIDWLTNQRWVQHIPGVQQVWEPPVISKNWFAQAYQLIQLAEPLKASGIDSIVLLQPNAKWTLLSWLILGWRRWNSQYVALYRKEKINVRCPEKRRVKRLHAVENFAQPFQQLFNLSTLPKGDLYPQLVLPDTATKALNLPAEPAYWVGVIPSVGNKRANRAWPLLHWETWLKAMVTRHPQTGWMIIGGPEDEPISQQLTQALSSIIPATHWVNTTGKLNILETAAHLAACRLVIGGDTGPLHLATAVGAPTVGLFAPTSLDRTGPVTPPNVRAIGLTPDGKHNCWPCERPVCEKTTHSLGTCTGWITPEQLTEAVLPFLV